MATVTLKLPHHRYEIHIQPGLLSDVGEYTQAVAPHGRAAILADENVREPHALAVVQSLEDAGYQVLLDARAMNEAHKSLDTVRGFYESLLNQRMERRSPILAVGGGIIGDTAGFVAATYLRGVPFIQVPTTLLAMVDASVGGKVGVNMPHGKNLIGAFYQPQVVLIDTRTLLTLPKRELLCGLAECVKHAVIRDPDLFAWIEQHLGGILGLDQTVLVELVERNVRIKAAVVMEDERETGVRAHLNFGHTFAHAIEAMQGYDAAGGYLHGEAVALGMVAATRLAVDQKRCDPDLLRRLAALLHHIGLPTRSDHLPDTALLLDAMRLDKKVKDDAIRLVLPEGLGQVGITSDVPDDAIEAAWDSLRDA